VVSGIHVEVAIGDPHACQVAPQSTEHATVTSVDRIPDPGADQTVIEEFTMTTDMNGVKTDGGTVHADAGFDEIFTSSPREVFRFRRESQQNCACEAIERNGCPVRDITAVDGTLHVTFVAADHETLRTILEQLTDRYDEMHVRRLLRSTESMETEQLSVVDIGSMTDRQQEILTAAHEAGYFAHPKEASAADVAETLGIAQSTFTEHLAAAQRNLLKELLD
jgi:hypothetical protein